MIKYNPKSWFSLIFQFHRSDTVRILGPTLISIALYTAIFVYVGVDVFHLEHDGSRTAVQVHSLLGIVLGLVLVFRTNTAYERWWEGRKLWGDLLNKCRNLAFKLTAFLPVNDPANRSYFAKMITNYVFAMKDHLRGKTDLSELEPVEDCSAEVLATSQHIPNTIARLLYIRCNDLVQQGKLSNEQLFIIDRELSTFTDIVGACERIKNTPIPYSYSLFMKKFIFLYIMTMPLGFVTAFEYWTVPVVMFVFYVLVSLEVIAEEIEDPFGTDPNDLPTEEIAIRIKMNMNDILLDRTPAVSATHWVEETAE